MKVQCVNSNIIKIGKDSISVNSIATLTKSAYLFRDTDKIFETFTDHVSHEFCIDILSTMLFDEPENYSEFIAEFELEHSPELEAVFEIASIDKRIQPHVKAIIESANNHLWHCGGCQEINEVVKKVINQH